MTDRGLVLEVIKRMREAAEMATDPRTSMAQRPYWQGRARAFDEVYTELKGRGYADKG